MPSTSRIYRCLPLSAARCAALFLFASLLFATGCKGFFVPVCQENNTCPGSCASGSSGTPTSSTPTITNLSPTTGAAGTSVTITGTNLTGATAVQFGNTAATNFANVSATQVTATAPAGTGAVSVSVTGPGGISNCVTFTYTTPAAGATSTTTAGYVYVANQSAGTIAGFSLSSGTTGGGKLTALSGSPYSVKNSPAAIAATPNGALLYMATPTGIYVYTVSSAGGLAIGNGSSAVTANIATYLTVDPSGGWLFAVSSGQSSLVEYQINTSTGALTPAAGNVATLTGGSPQQIYITPDNKNLFVTLSTGGIDALTLNSSTGALSAAVNTPSKVLTVNGDIAIGSDSSSRFLFVGETGGGTIRVFTIGANAALTEVAGSPFPTVLKPTAIAVDLTNTLLYVTDGTDNLISGYTLSSTGRLTYLKVSPFQTAQSPFALSLDPTGKYFVVASTADNATANNLQVFSFDSSTTGKLDPSDNQSTGSGSPIAISMAVLK